MAAKTVRRQPTCSNVVKRWLTIVQIEAMDSIGPVELSTPSYEYWVIGIRF